MPELTDIKLPETAVLANDCFAGCYKIKNLVIPRGNITLNGVNVGRTANVVLPDDVLDKLREKYSFAYQARVDATHSAVRFCTCWATKEENVDALLADIRAII